MCSTRQRLFSVCFILVFFFLPDLLRAEARSLQVNLKGTIFHYFIHVPEAYTGKRPFPLFVGIHAFEGKGTDVAAAFEAAADEYEFILVCPTFEGEYMKIESSEDLLLMKILKEVSSKYKVQNKIFMAGPLSGADFILRFTATHAQLVRGAALHAPLNPPPAMGRMGVPFSISAGMQHEQSYKNSQAIVEALTGANCSVKPAYYEDSGLDWSEQAQKACIEAYLVVDSGLSPEDRQMFEQTLSNARELMAQESFGKACSVLKHASKADRGSYYSNTQKDMIDGIERDGLARLKATLEAVKAPAILRAELQKLDAKFAGTRAGNQIRTEMGKIKDSVDSTPEAAETLPVTDAGETLSVTDDRKARAGLSNGKMLADAGKEEAAAKYLQKVIDQYPGSKYAAEAKQLLEKIGK